ncbi:MAG TPA: hypothetical protein VLA96_12085 [Terriglobales bacterium]|nr:hypothetical protein [Terriglobales bacterium]
MKREAAIALAKGAAVAIVLIVLVFVVLSLAVPSVAREYFLWIFVGSIFVVSTALSWWAKRKVKAD